MNIPSLRCLSSHQGSHSRRLTELVSEFRSAQIFNPSFLDWNDHWLITFRHRDRDALASSQAALLQGNMAGGPSRRVNLSEHAARFGVARVADPKLFRLGAEAWITFNDGHSDGENSVYLMPVAPKLGTPLVCQLTERRPVEKNWAFMLHGDRLKALYSVDPVSFISAPWPPPTGDSAVQFTHDASVPAAALLPKRNGRALSIGTQLSHDGANTWLVTHEKWYFRGKRMYFGRATRLNTQAGLSYSSRRLSHSLTSLVGARQKHNPRLISCTYFSGIVVRDGHAILGYGINDVAFNFAEIPVRLI
jgi:hypothetical protein